MRPLLSRTFIAIAVLKLNFCKWFNVILGFSRYFISKKTQTVTKSCPVLRQISNQRVYEMVNCCQLTLQLQQRQL
jgi:hypothetical protein